MDIRHLNIHIKLCKCLGVVRFLFIFLMEEVEQFPIITFREDTALKLGYYIGTRDGERRLYFWEPDS